MVITFSYDYKHKLRSFIYLKDIIGNGIFVVDIVALLTTSIRHVCYAFLHFLVRNRRHPRGLKCPKFLAMVLSYLRKVPLHGGFLEKKSVNNFHFPLLLGSRYL